MVGLWRRRLHRACPYPFNCEQLADRTRQNTNKHVRLTQDKPSQMGWLWSRLPITAANFEVEVEFKIGSDSTHLYGDGLAIWITKQRAQPGPVFGSVGESSPNTSTPCISV